MLICGLPHVDTTKQAEQSERSPHVDAKSKFRMSGHTGTFIKACAVAPENADKRSHLCNRAQRS